MNWMNSRTTESSAVPPPIPTSGPSSPSVDLVSVNLADVRRGQAVALLGLPDCAKTSFLYALKHAPLRTDGLRWSWPPSSRPLTASTGKAGEPLRATPQEDFRVARFGTLYRSWWRSATRRGIELFSPSRRITICEISGENVKTFASGTESPNPQIRSIIGDLERYLQSCNEVLFLAGVIGTESVHAKRPLTQEQLDNLLASAATNLRHVIGHMRGSRKSGDVIVATFLITKRDALRNFPSLDAVRVEAPGSALRAAVESSTSETASAVRALLQLSGHSDGFVSFSLNDVCDAAGADVVLHEAATADFLRCHAPTAAAALADLAAQRAISLRVLTCKPFGREFRTADGSRAFPDVNQMNISMVWESLDDLVERSFRWRRRSRLQFAGICAALALIGAFMVGPAYSSWTRSTADSAIKAYQSKSAIAPRIDVGDSLTAFDPWGSILRASFDGWSMDDAFRWKRFRDAVAEHHDGDTKDLKTLDEAIEARDPDGSLVTTDIRKRNRESITGFLQLSVAQAELLPALTSRSHLRLQLSDAEYVRKVVRDLRVDPPSSINGNSWTTVATNLAELESWIGTGVESGRPAIVVADAAEELPKLRSEIARSRSAAMIRADLANAKLTNSLPEDLSTLRKILGRALAVDDPSTVERIDRMLSDRIVSEWNALVPVDMRQPPVVPDIANAIRKSDKFGWPYVEDAWRLLALKSLDTWRGGVPAWFADSKVEEQAQATFLANASNQLKQCREVLFPGGTGRVDDLAPLDNALLLLSKRAKVLAGMKTEWQLAVVLPAIREAFADGTTANEPGIVAILPDVKFDFTRFADRQRAVLRAGLAERAMERTKAAITGTAAGAAQESQSIVSVAAAVGGQDSIPNWVNQANSLCRSFEAASAPTAADQTGIEAICSDPDAVKELPKLLPRLGRWPGTGAYSMIEATLSAISKSQYLNNAAKSECTQKLLTAVSDWTGIAPVDQLSEAVRRILQVAQSNGFDTQEFCIARFQEDFKAALSQVAKGDSLDSVVERVLRWQQLMAEQSLSKSASDFTDRLYAPQLVTLAAEVTERAAAADTERLLVALALKSEELHFHSLREAMSDLVALRKQVADFKLQPFFSEGAIVLYIGRVEFRRDSLDESSRKVLESKCPAAVPSPIAAPAQVPASPTIGSVTFAQADCIAKAFDLRLPTVAEWQLVRKSATDPGKKLLDWANSKRAAFTSAELEAAGDLAGSAEYPIVGMIVGFREWCSDSASPQGNSNRNPPGMRVTSTKLVDCGFRLAADPLPLSLSQWRAKK